MRKDIAALWDRFLVGESAKILGVSPEPEFILRDSTLQELRAAKFVGAWVEGRTLWTGSGLMVPSKLYPGVESGSPEHVRMLFSDYLNQAMTSEVPSQPESIAAYCMWVAVPAFFNRWALVDGDNGTDIPLASGQFSAEPNPDG